jgi:K+-sensing histidine kinase KdpD
MTWGRTSPSEGRWTIRAQIGSSLAHLLPTTLNLLLVAGASIVIYAIVGPAHVIAALLLYVIPVLAATRLWRLEQGIIAAFACALAAAYFFVGPLFSFRATNLRDVLALLIYLVASIVAGWLLDEFCSARAAAKSLQNVAGTRARLAAPAQNFGAASRTVPERVAEFLVSTGDDMYCDACIQEKLGLKWRQQVQLVTATLAVTEPFRRATGECRHCRQVKQVIHHSKPARLSMRV